MITAAQLIAIGVSQPEAEEFAEPLSEACKRFDIDTPQRIGAFLGQCMVETAAFARLEESLYYTSSERICLIFPSRVPNLDRARKLVRNPQALANCVYAHKNGNGDEESGDGWRFRGRGLIQLTGRANYHDATVGLSRAYLAFPDLVAQPKDASLTACWYWHNIKGNVLADAGEIDAITRAVNGRAMLHADVRRSYTDKATRALA